MKVEIKRKTAGCRNLLNTMESLELIISADNEVEAILLTMFNSRCDGYPQLIELDVCDYGQKTLIFGVTNEITRSRKETETEPE